MADSTCAKCGQPLPPDGQFCASCGTLAPRPQTSASRTLFDAGIAPAVAAAAAEKPTQATMFGFSAANLPGLRPPSTAGAASPAAPVAAPPAAAPTAPAPQGPAAAMPTAAAKQTMLGMPSPLARAAAAPSPAAAPPPAGAPGTGMLPSAKGTMLGVAIPGIAPLRASAPVEEPRKPGSGTMLGVALPGIAPVHASPQAAGPAPLNQAPAPAPARAKPVILPKPAPLVDDEPAIGPAPRVNRSGVPLAWVAGGIFALVLVFGVTVAFLWKGQSLIVVPRLDAQGRDQLHLTCDSCQDGTTAALDTATATFAAKEADLTLATPLQVGDNALVIRLDRPRWGRDEDVKVTVPVAFRIKPDLAGLTGAHPAVVVRVEAIPGTTVKVDGKPVTLDAKGVGTYSIDVSSQTTGWSDDLKLIEQAIPYSIATAGAGGNETEQHGTLPVRVGIASLHLDAPSPTAVIDTPSFHLAGRTVKGGTVTAAGQPVPVEPDGTFSRSFDAPSEGPLEVELRADGPQLASRTAKLTVKRVSRLADEAKARERAPWVDYAAMAADPAGNVGKDTVVEGDVVEARAISNQTVALVADSRGCTKDDASSCLVRVVYTGEEPMKHGHHVRVYGKVTGSFAAAGSAATVPVVRADFLVEGRRKGDR